MEKKLFRTTTLLKEYQVLHKRKKLENRIAKLKAKIAQAKRKLFKNVQARCPHPQDKIQYNLVRTDNTRYDKCTLCNMEFE